ncbi:MAG: DUF294 nucleotidyltransferase-like domain-containing protein, partial [Bacteroidota bacterium]
QLMELAGAVHVQYRSPQELIFKAGESPRSEIYLVREGAVEVLKDGNEEPLLVDICDEGDLFGIRPLLAQQVYALTARAMEETLLYAIPVESINPILDENPKVSLYLARNFAAGHRGVVAQKPSDRLFLRSPFQNWRTDDLHEIQTIEPKKNPICCPPDWTIQQAAKLMQEKRVGSMLITNEQGIPLGIFTDKDLRNQVVASGLPLDTPVEQIMNYPVITISAPASVADVQMKMVQHRIHHLCVTADGSPDTPVRGIVSEHDLLVTQGNNPAALMRAIQKSKTGEQLRTIREQAETLLGKYIFQEVSIAFISTILTEINDQITIRAIELAQQTMAAEGKEAPDGVDWCWLALGSLGRGEQLLRTDQDNALIFSDVPEKELGRVRAFFLELSQRITTTLDTVGFECCPADMMASNPQWCLSQKEWKAQFSQWILYPEAKALLLSNVFFDYRPVYGAKYLADELGQHIHAAIGEQTIFLGFLAKNALQNPPPLSFFRNFLVERSGEHKNEFDLKARAMMPLADAARVLTLEARLTGVNNTFRRFDQLAALEPQNQELFEQAADAYEIFMRYRALQGLKMKNSGRFFNPEKLSKMERLNLRNGFRPIFELQSLLTTRFQLNYLRT